MIETVEEGGGGGWAIARVAVASEHSSPWEHVYFLITRKIICRRNFILRAAPVDPRLRAGQTGVCGWVLQSVWSFSYSRGGSRGATPLPVPGTSFAKEEHVRIQIRSVQEVTHDQMGKRPHPHTYCTVQPLLHCATTSLASEHLL